MILKVDRVHKAYERAGVRFKALDEVTLDLFPGEMVGILGPAGAGKTSLLRVAAGLEEPDAGRVIYLGHPLPKCSAKEIRLIRRSFTSCIFGAESLNPGLSVFDNVAIKAAGRGASRGKVNWRIHGVIARCGLDHRLDAFPDDLTNAELRLLTIAQAVVSIPKLLLVDEPTQDLDVLTQRSVLKLLRSLAKQVGTGIVITSNDPMGIALTDRIYYIRDGIMVSSDAKTEIGEGLNAIHDLLSERLPSDSA